MKPLRIALNSLVLTVSDFAGILIGFMVYAAVGSSRQLAVQIPIAAGVAVLLFLLWMKLFGVFGSKRLLPCGGREFALVLLCSLLWNPVIFVPLHYVTQGYLTSAGNLTAMLLFQLPVNAIAVLVAWRNAHAHPAYHAGR